MRLPVCVFLQDKSQIPQEMPDMPNSQKMGELKAKVRLPHLNPSWALRVMCHWIGALGAKPEIVSVRVVPLCGKIWAIREFPFSFFFRWEVSPFSLCPPRSEPASAGFIGY